MFVDSEKIVSVFEILEENDIEYVLLRDVDKEIPFKFTKNKDIDLLINILNREKLHEILKKNGWKKIGHPYDSHNQLVYLYALNKFEFYTKHNINLDICFELCCKSPNEGEWLPLDQMINKSVWENRKKFDNNVYYSLSVEDELIHLLTRIIFDKKTIPLNYVKRIRELYMICDRENFIEKSKVVFFKFTGCICDWIDDECTSDIVKEYYSFCDY